MVLGYEGHLSRDQVVAHTSRRGGMLWHAAQDVARFSAHSESWENRIGCAACEHDTRVGW